MSELGDFSHLPPEVFEKVIFRCDLSALLQLRLVSKNMKTLLDCSTWLPEALEDIQIHINTSELKAFVEKSPRLPFSNFNIRQTSGDDVSNYFFAPFYTDPATLGEFQKSFCPRIRKLSILRMNCCTWDSEFEFFLSLQNLRELHIGSLEMHPTHTRPRLPFKKNLKLKRLIVRHIDNNGDYLTDLIKSCPALEVIQIPTFSEEPIWASAFGCADSAERGERYPYILRLGAQGHIQHLRTLDLNYRSMRMDVCSEEDLRFFKKLVMNKNFRLERVIPAFVLGVRNAVSLETFVNFQQRIVSFQGISDFLKEDLSNLEELNLELTHWVRPGIKWTVDLRPIQLPALRKIIAIMTETVIYEEETRDAVLRLFCPQEPMSSVKHLQIRYLLSRRRFDIDEFPHPLSIEPEHLDSSFPNLTCLVFEDENYFYSFEELERLVAVISRKVHLEECTLWFSTGIPEEAFFGANRETPVFLRLQNLKKLILKSTRQPWYYFEDQEIRMIGETMLELLSRMSLTHLYIIGPDWDRVTSRGIQSLLEGLFSQSVLRVRLQCLEDTESQRGKHSEDLERLAKVAHANQVAKGLTSTSFDKFKVSEEALFLKKHPPKDGGYTRDLFD